MAAGAAFVMPTIAMSTVVFTSRSQHERLALQFLRVTAGVRE
jgi:hypothetical protein